MMIVPRSIDTLHKVWLLRILTGIADLIQFIEKRVNATVIQQDLNTLLPLPVFQSIRGRLKEETLRLLNDEKRRVAQN